MRFPIGAAARRALLLVPFTAAVASAQSLGGLTLQGTGAGFAIPDGNVAGASSSITISGFTDNISTNANNQSVVVKLNNLRHTWVGDLTIRVNFASVALAQNITWTILARPGLFPTNSSLGYDDNFLGTYSFGEADAVSNSFMNDFDAYWAFNPNGNLPSGDYWGFDNQDVTSPGALFAGLNPNGVWSLQISDAETLDVGSVGSWDLAFQTNVVPEPSSVALLAGGLLAVAAAARRRRNA